MKKNFKYYFVTWDINFHYVFFYLWFLQRTCKLMQTNYIPLLDETYACMHCRNTRTSWQTKCENIEYSLHTDACREIRFLLLSIKSNCILIKECATSFTQLLFHSGISSIGICINYIISRWKQTFFCYYSRCLFRDRYKDGF